MFHNAEFPIVHKGGYFLMSQGYCPNCRRSYENAKMCGTCGTRLIINDEIKRSKLTIIGLICLFIYNISGLIISLNIAEKIRKGYQVFLVKIEISHFWLWFFFIVNIALLAGAIFFKQNKSLLCAVGQGVLWLLTLIISSGIDEISREGYDLSTNNGNVARFSAMTEVSRSVGVASFSLGHLFVIVLWIAAVVLVAMDIYRSLYSNN